MKRILARKALLATALVTTLFAGNGIAVADDAAPVLTNCNGLAQEAVFTNTWNAPVNKAGAVIAPIPFARRVEASAERCRVRHLHRDVIG